MLEGGTTSSNPPADHVDGVSRRLSISVGSCHISPKAGVHRSTGRVVVPGRHIVAHVVRMLNDLVGV